MVPYSCLLVSIEEREFRDVKLWDLRDAQPWDPWDTQPVFPWDTEPWELEILILNFGIMGMPSIGTPGKQHWDSWETTPILLGC